MKTLLLLAISLFAAVAVAADRVIVSVADTTGKPIANAQVVAILKSGAYQDTKMENGQYVCQPAEECVKVYAAAVGHEAGVAKYSGKGGGVTVTLKPNLEKDSAILRGRARVPGIDGELGPRPEGSKQVRVFAWKIALLENGKPAQGSVMASVGRPIEAQTGTGQKFKIWIADITPQVSLVEFTHPK